MVNKLSARSKSKSTDSSGAIASKAVNVHGGATSHHKQNITNGADRHEMIAMDAYYRTQKRNFNNGDEIQDWLEAEAEVDGLI